jgi:hypothetical protein
LNVNENEVESMLVGLVLDKRIEARIDQVNKRLLVAARCVRAHESACAVLTCVPQRPDGRAQVQQAVALGVAAGHVPAHHHQQGRINPRVHDNEINRKSFFLSVPFCLSCATQSLTSWE